MLRVLVFGGSIPAGKGVRRAYVKILEKELKNEGLEVINLAEKETTSFDGVNLLAPELERWSPWKVVIHYGVDDMYRPVYRSEFKENLVHMCRRAMERKVRVALATSHTFNHEYENQIAGIYYRAIREVAMDLGCDYIPVHMIWEELMKEDRRKPGTFFIENGSLLNEKGHRLLAGIMKYHFMKNAETTAEDNHGSNHKGY